MNTYLAIAIEQIYQNKIQNKGREVEVLVIQAEDIEKAKSFIREKEPEKTWAVASDKPFSENLVMRRV